MKSASLILSCIIGGTHLALAAPVADYYSQYEGVKVLRIPTGSPESVAELSQLIDSMELSKWTTIPVANSHIDLEVPTAKYDAFIKGVESTNSNFAITWPVEVMHEDLAASLKLEQEGMYKPLDKRAGVAVDAWFNAYHPYADHLTFINDLVATYPNNAKVVTSGTSLGGRPITGINIFGSGGSGTKPAVIIHSTVHAREWIGTMVNEYFAYSLLANYTTSAAVKSYVDKYDFYLFPVVNPDGFVYTQTTNRLWRKTRSTPPSGSTCYGTDINRNWAHSSWGQSGGASTSPCAEDYKGNAAASQTETKALAAFLNTRATSSAGAKMYFDIHSYSQLVMSPYGYSCSARTADATELNRLAAGYGTALTAIYGTRVSSGPICTTIYQASGGSVDYAYDNSKIKYSFTTELRDTGANGFVLPANQIRATGIENYAGLLYLLANMV